MVSETEYLVDLLDSNWNAAITALKTSGGGNGTIADVHAVHPIIMDIRDMPPSSHENIIFYSKIKFKPI